MTTWAPSSVAGFARAAGWPEPELALAVAIALAGSGGDDHRHVVPSSGSGAELVGLWLVPATPIASEPGADLTRPAYNAEVAAGLWEAMGGSWDWHPVYRAGTWRAQLDEATAALATADAGTTAAVVDADAGMGAGLRRVVASARDAVESGAGIVRFILSRNR